MTYVSGFLHTVIQEPSKVTGVSIRAATLRMSETGLTTPESERVDWDPDTGEVSFTAEPGEATLVLHYLSRSQSVPIGVPDLPTATLRQVIGIDYEYPVPVLSEVERLRNEAVEAAEVVGSAERVLEAEASVEADARRAETAATSAESWADALQNNMITEFPAGSGLYMIGGAGVALVEDDPGTGLYMIGVK